MPYYPPAGFVPEAYERYIVPLLMIPYAKDLAARVRADTALDILELACGTGVLTRELAKSIPSGAIVATDFSDAMLAYARESVEPHSEDLRVSFQQADACNLAFDEDQFDVVVCQFGLMFFPDKPKALADIRRLTKPGGRVLFNVWGSMPENPIFHSVEQAMEEAFPEEEGLLIPTPCSMADPILLKALFEEAGFKSVVVTEARFPVKGHPASQIATGFIHGTPILTFLLDKGVSLDEMQIAMENKVSENIGDPIDTFMVALICEAVA